MTDQEILKVFNSFNKRISLLEQDNSTNHRKIGLVNDLVNIVMRDLDDKKIISKDELDLKFKNHKNRIYQLEGKLVYNYYNLT